MNKSFGHHCLDAQCYGYDEISTLPRTAPTRFLNQKCHTTMAYLTQGINTPTTRGTDHTPIMALDIGDISAGHSPVLIPTESAAACVTPHVMDGPITPHTLLPTGKVTLHPTLTTSPVGATHATPQTGASLAPAAPSTQHKDLSPGKSSNAQDPKPPINPTAPKLSPSRIPLQTLHQIMTVILKL